jgi:hypothetical protein
VDIEVSDGGLADAGLLPKLPLMQALAKVRARKMLFPSKG